LKNKRRVLKISKKHFNQSLKEFTNRKKT